MKVWSPTFNLKHSSSDYILAKRKQTLYSLSESATPPTYTVKFPSYWMRRNILDGNALCDPCPENIPATLAEKQLKQYE